MAGPWEKYQTQDGPWSKFQSSEPAAPVQPMSRTDKVLKGVADPIEGGAQLLTNLLPDGVVKAGNSFNNWLADKTGLVARLPEGGINELVKQQEAEYQAKRAAAGETGFDGYRMLGNVVSPANLAIASRLPSAAAGATTLAKAGYGAGGGAASAMLSPVTEGDYWSEKGKQAVTGAAGGSAVPMLTKAVSRVISPNASVNPQLQLLKQEGVKPTIGQTLGGWANRAEEKAQSLPIIGDAIAAARNRSTADLNRAAFNRALEPLGQKLPIDVKIGNDAVEYTRKTLGAAYDNLLPKLNTQVDQTFVTELGNLKNMVQQSALDPKYVAGFERTLQQRVFDKFQGQNSMSGETLKDVQSFLTNEIKRYGQSQDPDARLIGDAFKEVGDQLNQLVVRSNPALAGELKAINTGYANFKRVQKAAGYLGAEDGVFSAANLQGAVKAADKSKDKARFADGTAFMQDLSSAGKNLLSNKVPNSGTIDRLAFNGTALGSGLINPAIPAGLLGGAAMYTPQMQALLRGAISSRPQAAKSIANTFEQAAPFLIPGGAQVGLGLLN